MSFGCHTKVKEASLPYYLPMVGGGIVRFTPFPRLLTLCEMQTPSLEFELGLPCPFSYDGNHYTSNIYMYNLPGVDPDQSVASNVI